MIKKIAHFADYHIHNIKWHERYREGNKFIYNKLKELKPDRIILAGDLFESYIQISNEAEVLASELLNNLSKIASVIITEGNHDIRKKDLKRISSIKTVVSIMANPNITHYGKSGFYEDDNIIWVNHSHLEKDINPWNDIPHTKDKTKTYIDIWHDPINGCITDAGFEMKSKGYRNVSDFKGDIGMFGDIHKFQYLNSKETIAYPSSTYQQDMGEDVEEHGFMMWDITDKSSELIIVPDDYKLITFRTTEDYDYDNIDFDHPLATEKSEFRVIWKDYSSNINNENKSKLNKYISDKWNDNIKYDPQRIYTNVASSQKLTESININDKQVQQEIFTEYLKANKYDDAFIDEILKIDNIIDDRLEIKLTSNNVEWTIKKLWVDNFKSYDKFELDWTDVNGIIQLNGENQQGKTTILDAITYITHGTTLATNKLGGGKTEKFGDNRYINNKRKLDYCEGGMVIDVSGEEYTLHRKTERTFKKDKVSISSVSTNIEYYEGPEINEDKKLRGERKTQTQNKIDAIIGDFDDFIRLTLTNSENLNSLISLDRATFIDSVIRDAGYDIFEKKLAEFKEYKKQVNTEKININLNDAKEEVDGLKDLLKTYKTEHDEIKESIKDVDEKIITENKNRDIEIKKLYKIDEEVSKINIDSANEKIEEYKNTIETNLKQQKINSDKLVGLKQSYDKEKYDSLLKEIKKIEDDILNMKLKISQEETNIEKEKSNIVRVHDKIKSLKQKEIDHQRLLLTTIYNDVEKITNELDNAIKDKRRELVDEKKSLDFESKTLSNKLLNIKEKGIDKKNQIKELEEAVECPSCGADPKHQKNRTTKIDELNNDVTELLKQGKKVQSELEDIKNSILAIQLIIDDLDNEYYSDDIIKLKENVEKKLDEKKVEINIINNICDQIKSDDYTNVPDLENNINMGLNVKKNSEDAILTRENNISLIKQDIKDLTENKNNLQSEVYLIEKDKEQVKTYEYLTQDNKELSLKIENIKLTIENAKSKIDKYYDQLKYIKENEIIESNIENFDLIIRGFNVEKDNFNSQINEIMKDASVTKVTIKDIQDNIKKYTEQVKRDEILKEYQKCVARDGIPSFLLQKSRHLINTEIEDMLTNVDFDIFFDEYLNLKMYMKNAPWAIQNLLESSGKERTFGAVALKQALRTINNKSRPNLFLMDEVMLKLKGKSVEEFNNLLLDMKKRIDKVVVIEHVHEIPYDIIINVSKNEEGISCLDIQ